LHKSVALCGFAPNTLPLVRDSKAQELWSLVWGYKYTELPRIDRLYELHPVWVYAESNRPVYAKLIEHDTWLRTNELIPVYGLERRSEWPMSNRYPIERVEELLGSWEHSGARGRMFTSSFDYMIAHAVLDGYQRIEIYGAEMSTGTEYAYQREGFAFWAGFCAGRGIEFIQYSPSRLLLRPRRYGYEGVQLISRQDLEREAREIETQRKEKLAHVQYLEGATAQAKKALDHYRESVDGEELEPSAYQAASIVLGRLKDEWIAKSDELTAERLNLASIVGASKAITDLISNLDLESVDKYYGYSEESRDAPEL